MLTYGTYTTCASVTSRLIEAAAVASALRGREDRDPAGHPECHRWTRLEPRAGPMQKMFKICIIDNYCINARAVAHARLC